MCVGVLKEIKNYEYWVGLILDSVYEMVVYGYVVYVEMCVGEGIGVSDVDYEVVGVMILLIV